MNTVPMSSLGTSPVFVVRIIHTRATTESTTSPTESQRRGIVTATACL